MQCQFMSAHVPSFYFNAISYAFFHSPLTMLILMLIRIIIRIPTLIFTLRIIIIIISHHHDP